MGVQYVNALMAHKSDKLKPLAEVPPALAPLHEGGHPRRIEQRLVVARATSRAHGHIVSIRVETQRDVYQCFLSAAPARNVRHLHYIDTPFDCDIHRRGSGC